MTSLLHDNLCGLGLDKLPERAAEDIARKSAKAAQRVLYASDIAIPLPCTMDSEAGRIFAAL